MGFELASSGYGTDVLPIELSSQLGTVSWFLISFKCTRDSRDNIFSWISSVNIWLIDGIFSSCYPEDDSEIESKHCSSSRISSVKLSRESLVHVEWIKRAYCSQLTRLINW